MKKKWEDPKLVILVRNRPEESIMTTCKDSGQSADISGDNGGCEVANGGCIACFDMFGT